MEKLTEILTEIGGLIWDGVAAVFGVIPTIFKFTIWVLLAFIVLPCVFVAGNIYPWWVEWGEDF